MKYTIDKKLLAPLKKYQRDAAIRIANSYQTILADEMGLGKTATAIVGMSPFIRAHHIERLLIVCPASLKQNWKEEVLRWWPTLSLLDDRELVRTDQDGFCTHDYVYVTNYEKLPRVWQNDISCAMRHDFRKSLWTNVIFDEAHYLKNPDSQRHYYAKKIAKLATRKLLITGTPMASGPCDIAALLDVLGLLPDFGGYDGFYKRYCDPVYTGYGWDYSGASHQTELKKRLRPYLIRRTKKSCGIKLPPKKIINVPICTCDQPYASTLGSIESQTRQVNEMKWEPSVKFIDDLLSKGKRPVIFVHHRAILARLLEHYKGKAQGIYGGQKMKERDKVVKGFQAGEFPIIVCSLQASATGLTLTSSDTVVFMEYLWSPAVSKQAQDRVHRISQTRPVTIYNLYCPGSIEVQKDLRSYSKELDMDGIL